VDFKELPYIDINKPYWNRDYYDSLALMGKHFTVMGDITRRSLLCTWIMCFNKDIIEANKLENPYDLVKNGKWTYDKMIEMAKQIGNDLNSDGKMVIMDDMWGINYDGDSLAGIYANVGVRLAELDAEGVPQLIMDTEINLTKLVHIYTTIKDTSYSVDMLFHNGGTGLTMTAAFGEERALFLAGASQHVEQLRAIDTNFGIIPYPKWDEAQEKYMSSTAGSYHPTIVVPQTNDDLFNTSVVMESLAYWGKELVSPEFYESLLKTKTARDEESSEMIDYIFGNIIYDIGNMYNLGGDVRGLMIWNNNANLVSLIERNKPVWQKTIDDLMKTVMEAD